MDAERQFRIAADSDCWVAVPVRKQYSLIQEARRRIF